MQPPGGKIPAARRLHDPLMNGTSLTDANGTARPQIGASSFRALQERLWAVRSRPAPARKAEAGAGEEAPAAQPAPADEAGQEPSGAVAEASETSSAEPSEQYLAGGEAAPEGLPSATEAGDDILHPLVAKFSGTAALLKKIEPEIDPFSATSAEDPFAPGLADPQSGDVARSLLDVMSAPPGSSQPQERSLAADTLLRLVPRLPLKSLANLVERVSRMEAPPQLLVRRLIRDARSEIAGPLLERASAISDQDLMVAISEGDAAKQRLIARRRTISPALSDALIEAGDAGALLTLVRNPGASFSIESFHRLGALAAEMPALQAPLSTRLDTPAPVAFELFWALPAELRRYVLSRFLTDSETLDRVLKIALSVGNGASAEVGSSEP